MSTVVINGQTWTVYADDVAAGLYFDARIGGAQWSGYVSPQGSGQTSNDLKRALVTSTNMTNQQLWQGTPVSPTQALAWPRSGVIANGVAVDSSSIPTAITNGYFELALALLLDPDSVLTQAYGTTNNTRLVKAGSAEVESFRPQPGSRLPTAAQDWFSPYMGGVSQGESTAGDTCAHSRFQNDRWSILKGL